MNWFTSPHHSSPITHHQKLAHGGYAIGSRRFREEIENALKQRAMPREPSHSSGIIGKITENSSNEDTPSMKTPIRSAKAPARGPANRKDVRKQVRRVNVPRSSQRPVERSKQRRSRRP